MLLPILSSFIERKALRIMELEAEALGATTTELEAEAIEEPITDDMSLQERVSSYIRRKPPSQDCTAEQMITIETVSLRKGGWRNTEGFLNDLRHMDPNVGVMIFFGAMTAIIFFMYLKKYRSILMSSVYTTSSVALLALALSATLGIDFFGALGVLIMPH